MCYAARNLYETRTGVSDLVSRIVSWCLCCDGFVIAFFVRAMSVSLTTAPSTSVRSLGQIGPMLRTHGKSMRICADVARVG